MDRFYYDVMLSNKFVLLKLSWYQTNNSFSYRFTSFFAIQKKNFNICRQFFLFFFATLCFVRFQSMAIELSREQNRKIFYEKYLTISFWWNISINSFAM